MRRMMVALMVFVTAGLAPPVTAGGSNDTAFTYQGELKENGDLANGSYDMDLSLWDALSGGKQIGSTIALKGVPVADGKSTVALDFGADAFDNANRWLEIVVNSTTLTPRHPITRSPYSIQTRGMVIGDDGNVTFNSMSAVEGSMTITSIGGIDLIIDADTNNVGEDQNARIVMKQDGGQVVGRMGYREATNTLEIMQEYDADLVLGTNNEDRLTILADGFVGAGRDNPISAAEYFGVHAPVGTDEYGGMYMSTGAGGWPFYGYYAGGNSMWHYFDSDTGSWHLYNGGSNRLTVRSNGTVGIGTISPQSTLHVQGEGTMQFAISAENGDEHGIIGSATAVGTAGVWGVANGDSGLGVYGRAYGNGNTSGVAGTASSPTGTGVSGFAYADSGTNYGVCGQSESPNGYDFYAAGAGQDYGSSSSIRWKHNVRNIHKPLEKVARLRGVYFDWDKDHGGHHDVGMIAEEVGEVLPEIVNYEDNGIDAIGMDYSKLTPLLVEAVNALRRENEELRARLYSVEQIVNEVAARPTPVVHAGVRPSHR